MLRISEYYSDKRRGDMTTYYISATVETCKSHRIFNQVYLADKVPFSSSDKTINLQSSVYLPLGLYNRKACVSKSYTHIYFIETLSGVRAGLVALSSNWQGYITKSYVFLQILYVT